MLSLDVLLCLALSSFFPRNRMLQQPKLRSVHKLDIVDCEDVRLMERKRKWGKEWEGGGGERSKRNKSRRAVEAKYLVLVLTLGILPMRAVHSAAQGRVPRYSGWTSAAKRRPAQLVVLGPW